MDKSVNRSRNGLSFTAISFSGLSFPPRLRPQRVGRLAALLVSELFADLLTGASSTLSSALAVAEAVTVVAVGRQDALMISAHNRAQH